ncbi:hypothetical protein CLAFUW4_04258 [Fulvia fulva]|nr:hypothetical protein CLAFUR4_04244 [Fulvia fulva]WPV13684.1 hypothetical protein CLAFUW4_04258 [Fulvia fulva]
MPRKIKGPPTEKQRFEEYERRIRLAAVPAPTAAQKTRTAQERTSLQTATVSALDANELVRRRRAVAVAEFLALFQLYNVVFANQPDIGDELNSGRYKATVGQCQRQFVRLRSAQVTASTAWQALLQEHTTQLPRSDAISIAAANAELNQANADIADTDFRLQGLQLRLDSPPVAADAAGVRKVRKRWLPTEIFQRWRFAQDAASIVPPATINADAGLLAGGWDVHRQVGEGGQGTASLWLGFNANQRVSRRVVRKYMDESIGWYDARKFAGADVRSVNNRLPWELESHEEMMRAQATPNNLPRNDHIVATGVPATAALVNNPTKTYRIYTEWCPRGNLDSIIAHYRTIFPPRAIPEPFIWAVAEALTFAGLAMQFGSEQGVPLPGWQPIVHRDLKPANIFLGHRSNAPNAWRWYPTPRLGDFGLAVQPNAYGASNPQSWQDLGTQGFYAPEQMDYVNRNTHAPLNPWPLDEKTNLFGVGLILYCLVTQKRNAPQAYWLGDGATDTTHTLHDVVSRMRISLLRGFTVHV